VNTSAKIRTYETMNNEYHVITIAKTTYEQRQERKAERLYMIRQKTIGSIVMVASLFPAIHYKEPKALLMTAFFFVIGFCVTFTKEHITG
jgi:hypothetical protein